MATRGLGFLKCPANLAFLRSSKNAKHPFKTCQYSTSEVLNCQKEAPVKFSSSQAAKITIGETTGIDNLEDSKWKKFLILSSLGIFLLYFCVLREENDIDEILNGNHKSDETELIDLKIKLAYCKTNNLPTTNIRLKMEEIIQRNSKPVFPK